MLRICFGSEINLTRDWLSENADRYYELLAHEIFHGLQYQITGNDREMAVIGSRSVIGPEWLVEGAAEFMARRATYGTDIPLDSELDYLYERASGSTQTLDRLEVQFQHSSFEDYTISDLAASLLAIKFGTEALIGFWKEAGTGADWESAFEASFGLSLEDYQQLFETLRRDPKAAASWISGT